MKVDVYNFSKDKFGTHSKIIEGIVSNSTVLEIGCASGYMSSEFKKKGCLVTAIEIEHSAAAEAKQYCQQVIIGDVENSETLKRLGDRKYQVIVLADVLEHLKSPQETLSRLIKFLNEGGSVIISVPNIAFLTDRLLLLLGKFDYTDWGIMDRTHLRFFTKKSILNLVESVGLRMNKFDYVANFTQLPLYMQTSYRILGKRDWWRRIEYRITGLWPEGLAVQFLLFCHKDEKNYKAS